MKKQNPLCSLRQKNNKNTEDTGKTQRVTAFFQNFFRLSVLINGHEP